jgi:hypothetical protein
LSKNIIQDTCGNYDPWTYIMVSLLLRSYEKMWVRVIKKGIEDAF